MQQKAEVLCAMKQTKTEDMNPTVKKGKKELIIKKKKEEKKGFFTLVLVKQKNKIKINFPSHRIIHHVISLLVSNSRINE
jgi:hypothetical protein